MDTKSVKKIQAFIKANKKDELFKMCDRSHPADIASIFYSVSKQYRARLMSILMDSLDPETIFWFESDLLRICFEIMGINKFTEMLSSLDISRISRIILKMPQDLLDIMSYKMDDKVKALIESRFKYKSKSIGRLMNESYATVPHTWDIREAHNFLLQKYDPKNLNTIVVVDLNYFPVGIIHSIGFISCKFSTPVTEIMEKAYVFNDLDIVTNVILSFKKYELSQGCVIDSNKRLIGCVSFVEILRAVENESSESTMQLHGIIYSNYLEDGMSVKNSATTTFKTVFLNVKSRMPWIFVNLLMSFVASNIVMGYDQVISRNMHAAALMSIVASTAGNFSAQSIAITVRTISKTKVQFLEASKIMINESLTSLLSGFLILICGAGISFLMYEELMMSCIFGVALFLNFCIAGIMGAVIPILLEKWKIDPASGSNIIASAVTDICGLLIFLSMISWGYSFFGVD